MGLAEHLSGEALPCSMKEECMNSPVHRGPQAQCVNCKFADQMPGLMNFFKPWNPKLLHPKVQQLKQDRKTARQAAAQAKRDGKDRGKQKLQVKARQAEATTNRRIIRATRNSGRTAKDADHVHAGRITIDTKLQSNAENPRVLLAELDQVRADARRAGNPLGALILRNKHGRGVVVFDEEDYARLFAITVKQYLKEAVEHARISDSSGKD
jgi:hypothetical protein